MTGRIALAVALLLAAAVAQQTKLVLPAVNLTAAWVSVPLPDRPLDVVEHDGALWVCGTNESIARSTDGGRHWQLLVRRPAGQILFSLTFPDPSTIVAFGTEGVRLISHDGGANWQQVYASPTRSLMQVEFADGKLVYAIGEGGYALSRDGGASWKFEDVDNSGGLPVQALAVRDALHAALIRNGDPGKQQELLTTNDGGYHFQKFKLGKEYSWDTIRATDAGFVVYGDRGAAGSTDTTPAAAVFNQTSGWQVAPDPASDFYHCNAQGCLVDGGWVEFKGSQAEYWGQADDEAQPLVRSWAVAGDTFCEVSEEVRCRTAGRGTWKKPVPTAPAKVTRLARCQKCNNPQYPRNTLTLHRQGRVVIRMIISKTGVPFDLVLDSAASGSLTEAALTAIRAWRYQPMEVDGKPAEASISVSVGYTMGQYP